VLSSGLSPGQPAQLQNIHEVHLKHLIASELDQSTVRLSAPPGASAEALPAWKIANRTASPPSTPQTPAAVRPALLFPGKSVSTRLDTVNILAAFQSAPDTPFRQRQPHLWIHARIVLHRVASD
jgi:hypothetical protein